MKYTILLLLLSGCSTLKQTNHKKALLLCVENFLDRGISPKASYQLCDSIYRVIGWENERDGFTKKKDLK